MTESPAPATNLPIGTLVAAGLVALGIALWMLAGKEYIVVAGLGAFGPGVLRELGWLREHDEFQRETARRAGYHAYLTGGVATTLVVSALHITGTTPRFPAELLTWVLVVMWLTWLFSALLAYWGAATMTRAVLGSFGGFWGLFILLDLLSEPATLGQALQGLGVGAGILAPFVGVAIAAKRWPRGSGVALILASAGLTAVFFRPTGSALAISTQLFTFTTLVAPLAACGIALLRSPVVAQTD